MLQLLRIRNLALVDAVELQFDRGFTAVTGETGAGKSILLGALAILAGNRVDKSIIGSYGQDCEIEAVLFFSDPEFINNTLAAMELPLCEEGTLLLRRSLCRTRASQVQINGRLTTLANLQNLSSSWIDFHGPGEPQKLFHVKWQLDLLDQAAHNGERLTHYQRAYHAWIDGLRACQDVRDHEQLGDDEVAALQREIEKFDRAQISPDNISSLERDYSRLSQAQEILDATGDLERGLGSHKDGIAWRLGQLLVVARRLSHVLPEAQAFEQRLESLVIEAADLSESFAETARSSTFDEREAHAIQERMALWLALKRKYGPSVEEALTKREDMQHRIDLQGNLEGTLFRLEKAAEAAHKEACEHAAQLQADRSAAARLLEENALRVINALGFKKARFCIEIISEPQLREYGDSSCRFLFAPNAGQPLLPLERIASSGEIARVMLALKAVLARADATPVLVFDEVDANVGGEVGAAVGRELAHLGEHHQVLCITHLPQVAALAENHFVVVKDQDDDSTTVSIRAIHNEHDERLIELARMLGNRNSKSAKKHAAELLR